MNRDKVIKKYWKNYQDIPFSMRIELTEEDTKKRVKSFISHLKTNKRETWQVKDLVDYDSKLADHFSHTQKTDGVLDRNMAINKYFSLYEDVSFNDTGIRKREKRVDEKFTEF